MIPNTLCMVTGRGSWRPDSLVGVGSGWHLEHGARSEEKDAAVSGRLHE